MRAVLLLHTALASVLRMVPSSSAPATRGALPARAAAVMQEPGPGAGFKATRRGALALAALVPAWPALAAAPPGFEAPPTYSLKGLTAGLSALTGSDAPPPSDLGVIGRGMDGSKSGRLGFCDKKGCISSQVNGEDPNYVPPWTFDPKYSARGASSFDSRKQAILAEARAEAAAEAAGGGEAPAALAALPEPKTAEAAFEELRKAVEAAPGATVMKAEDRYLYAEFKDPGSGAVDDVEFLVSKDVPIVNYRSAPRKGEDDKRQRGRIRDLRKTLEPLGWKSVGRLVE